MTRKINLILHSEACVNRYLFNSDINECDADNGGCSHDCVNKEGSFECKCNSGFELEDDNKACKGITSYHYWHKSFLVNESIFRFSAKIC